MEGSQKVGKGVPALCLDKRERQKEGKRDVR